MRISPIEPNTPNNDVTFKNIIINNPEKLGAKLYYEIATNEEVRSFARFLHSKNADLVASVAHRDDNGGVIQFILQFEAKFNDMQKSVKVFSENIVGDVMAKFNAARCKEKLKMEDDFERLEPENLMQKATEAINNFNKSLLLKKSVTVE